MPYLVKRKAEIKKLIGQILFQKVFIDFCHVSLDRKKFKKNIGLRSFMHKNQQILQQQTKSDSHVVLSHIHF